MRPLPGAAPGPLEAADGLQQGDCSAVWGLLCLREAGPQPVAWGTCGGDRPGLPSGVSASPTPGWQNPGHEYLPLPGHQEGLWELGLC